MLIFRVKKVLIRRERQNAFLLMLLALPANVAVVLMAAGISGLMSNFFLCSLAAYFAFFGLGLLMMRKLLIASICAYMVGVFSFVPGYFMHTGDWRWFLLGFLPAAFLGWLLLRAALRMNTAVFKTDGAILLQHRRNVLLYGPRTVVIMAINSLSLLLLGMALSRFDLVCMRAWNVIGCMALTGAIMSFAGERKYCRLHGGHFHYLIVLVLGVKIACMVLGEVHPSMLLSMALLLLINIRYLTKAAAFESFADYFFLHPAMLLVASFVGVILGGTYLLALPWALHPGQELELIDALFISTSATCVTGLSSVDVVQVFSVPGQFIVMCLMQIGGLGIMTLSTFSAIILGRSIGLRQEYFVKDMLGENRNANVLPLTVFICLATFVIEIIGAAAMFPQMLKMGLEPSVAAWKSVFHSVSAFCNGGFSLQSDSLFCFKHHPGILLTITMLIVCGGLGFGVLSWICRFLTFRRPRPNFYVNVVLWSSIILLLIGTIGFLMWDGSQGLDQFDRLEKVTNAFFCSATARTAGFATFDLNDMSRGGRLLTMVLMFIGGAPGSTAGGVKLTTMVVFLAMLLAVIRGREDITFLRCSFNSQTVWRAVTVFMLYVMTTVLGFGILLTTESGAAGYEDILFEAVSAIGTTGLTMGLTEHLSVLGRLVIIAMMFIGRLGPLTLLLLLPQKKQQKIEYPKARLMVG